MNEATITSGRQPQAHTALLVAYEMKFFNAFGPEDKELSVYELISVTGAEELLLGRREIVPFKGSVACSRLLYLVRIMIALAYLGIFDEVDESK